MLTIHSFIKGLNNIIKSSKKSWASLKKSKTWVMSAQPWVWSWSPLQTLNPLSPSNLHSNLTSSKRTITIKLEKSQKSGKSSFILPQKTLNLSTELFSRFLTLMKWSAIFIEFSPKHPPKMTRSWFPESITSKTPMINSRSSNTMWQRLQCTLTLRTTKMHKR